MPSPSGAELLQELVSARKSLFNEHAMIIVAHPDDETIGIGAQLRRFQRVTLVHVTDGAPTDLIDAHRAGFNTARSYAKARKAELSQALDLAGAHRIERIALDVPDQEAPYHIPEVISRIKALISTFQADCVFTHPYEGGHPDHDAVAFCVHHACNELPMAPIRIEMAFYHRFGGELVTGCFLPASTRNKRQEQIWVANLSREQKELKAKMLSCFTTQQQVLAAFDLNTESFRIAPDYDFTHPPHPGMLHYEALGFRMSGPLLCLLMQEPLYSR